VEDFNMRRNFVIAFTALAGVTLTAGLLWAQVSRTAEVQFKAAQQKELVEGDLKGAIKEYEKIANGKDRALAAQALLRMAECYQKLGDADANKVYQRLIRDFADQTAAVSVAQARLGGAAGAGASRTLAQRLLCTDCGDYEATTTIDGRWIAYTDWETGDVAIRDLGTGQVKRLMAKSGSFQDSAAYVEEPVLSPDLRQVAFLWHTGGSADRKQLRVMANEPGAKPRVLVEADTETSFYEPTGWSADGKSILTLVGKADRTNQLAWVSAADGAVRTIKSLQWRLKGIGSTDPKVSPDGRFIAYTALAVNPTKVPPAPTDPEDRHIYLLAADGSSETDVVKTAGLNKSPVWAPDGKHLLFLSARSGNFALWSVPIESGRAAGSPSLVHATFGTDSDWVWPIGVTQSGSFYYVLDPRGVDQISITEIDSAGRKLQGRSQVESFVGIRPAWSPDGRSVAFKRHHPFSARSDDYRADVYDLVVHSLETGEEKTFPTALGDHDSVSPEWFHDGEGILVGLTHNGTPIGGYRVDVETGEFKQILDGPLVNIGAPMWLSPDDKTLYIFRGGIVAHDLATNKDTEILRVPAGGRLAHRLSPDGRTFVIWRVDPQARKSVLGLIDADGSNFRELYSPAFTTVFTHLAWSKDGRAILFKLQDKPQVMRISAQGGTPEPTGIEVTDSMMNMDISPAGSRLAYSATKAPEELWSLDNVLAALK
jgi:Tol biopolymer transport system component